MARYLRLIIAFAGLLYLLLKPMLYSRYGLGQFIPSVVFDAIIIVTFLSATIFILWRKSGPSADGYKRLEAWIVQKIGKTKGMTEGRLASRIQSLYVSERHRVGDKQTAGLKAYVEQSKYRSLMR